MRSILIALLLAACVAFGFLGCAALLGTPAQTNVVYRAAVVGEVPDGELWNPPAEVRMVGGSLAFDGKVPFASGSLAVMKVSEETMPAKPGLVQQANIALVKSGAAETPWGGVATLVLTAAAAAAALWQRQQKKAVLAQGGQTLATFEKTPADVTGVGSAQQTIIDVGGKASALLKAYLEARADAVKPKETEQQKNDRIGGDYR